VNEFFGSCIFCRTRKKFHRFFRLTKNMNGDIMVKLVRGKRKNNKKVVDAD